MDFTEARDSNWQWHQLQVCTSHQTDNHGNTPPLGLVYMPLNQQHQSTEGISTEGNTTQKKNKKLQPFLRPAAWEQKGPILKKVDE